MLAIFDLDGTLLNTAEDLGNAVNHTLRAHGLPVHGIPEYRMMVGRGMRNLVKAALPEDRRDDEFTDIFLKEFLEYYLGHIDDRTVPYPGICGMLDTLDAAGVKIAVASNKLQQGTEHLINGFFPGIPFVAICGNSPEFPLKPDAGPACRCGRLALRSDILRQSLPLLRLEVESTQHHRLRDFPRGCIPFFVLSAGYHCILCRQRLI